MKKLLLAAMAALAALCVFAACCTKQPADGPQGGNTETGIMTDEIYFTVGNCKIAVKLQNNAAAAALVKMLKEGDITYTAGGYGGFEVVGGIKRRLPQSDTKITTLPGDVVLYSGDQIVLFYGSNTWEYTKLGKMQGLTDDNIRDVLTQADPITITISLH